MAYVGGYEYDVFVSYAHADNVVAGDGPWVERFVRDFHGALSQRLGDPKSLEVFFDQRNADNNLRLPELVEKASRSAILIVIGSRSYVTHDWTCRELQGFDAVAHDSSRIFVVECLPLDDGERYPAPIESHVRLPFWRLDEPTSATPMPISPSADGEIFRKKVHDLAEQVRKRLVAMARAPLPTPPPVPPPGPSATPRRVLIAQPTDDLAEEADDLRRYLGQYPAEIEILPAAPYPQGGDAFRAAFAADLAKADLFAQLLGPRSGRTSPDLPEGYTRSQAAAAAASGVKTLQWRRPGLQPASVADDAYRPVLAGEHVVEDTFETFKAMVLKAARTPPQERRVSRPGFTFIDADSSDLDIARQVQAEFATHRLASMLPVMGASAEDIRTDLEENFVDCDALILVYGSAAPVWVRSQLKLFNKVRARRSTDPRLIAIYTGPPPDKPEHGISFPDAREIDSRASWNLDKIRSLISELEQ